MDSYEQYYQKKLAEGREFQDFVARVLYARGIVIIGYSSYKFQKEQGENMLGAEIKRDGKFRETGNLYIETAEKMHPKNEHYVPSGILRGDNSWLFVIGDEKTIYIFSVKELKRIMHLYDRKVTPTSKGFLMPLAHAEWYCIRRIDL